MADDDPIRRADSDDSSTVRGLTQGSRVFGRYALDAEIGRGGMGVVWRARDVELDEPVALKFLPEVVARDDAAVAEWPPLLDRLEDRLWCRGGILGAGVSLEWARLTNERAFRTMDIPEHTDSFQHQGMISMPRMLDEKKSTYPNAMDLP